MSKWTGVACACAALLACGAPPPETGSAVTAMLSDRNTAGYARAYHPVEMEFPRDHGAHPRFKHEWWYFTGQVTTSDGRVFGYQFTLFRYATSPQSRQSVSAWATEQVYMAHAALTDVKAKKLYQHERLARGALGLAGVSTSPLRMWLENWEVQQGSADCAAPLCLKLHAASEDFTIRLDLTSQKPAVLHGERGLSRKSNTPGNASYYYSNTRLETRGEVLVNKQRFAVEGASWFDHEWSTSALEADQAGWDWFSVQLSDGTELMLYRIRDRHDPSRDNIQGTWIGADGSNLPLDRDAIVVDTNEYWDSPHSGARYPAGWTLRWPARELSLELEPLIADQEMNLSFRYWEGAVRAQGSIGTRPVRGRGYVELTGYDRGTAAAVTRR